jgi:hypothetical protein
MIPNIITVAARTALNENAAYRLKLFIVYFLYRLKLFIVSSFGYNFPASDRAKSASSLFLEGEREKKKGEGADVWEK